MSASDLGAWFATALYPATGVAGCVFRRFVSGPFVARLRPHYYLGYVVLALGIGHTLLSLGNVPSIGSLDTWIAIWALVGLGLQTFIGLSLQAPGGYRQPLRRWHLIATFAVFVLILGHVVLSF